MDKNSSLHRHSIREIKRELRAIYTDDSGKIPDMTKLSSRKRSTFSRFLIKGILFLGIISIVAWSGFLLFSGNVFQKQESLIVKIDGPKEIKSGQKISYAIRYENTGDVPLASLEMTLNVSQNFHLLSSVPKLTKNQTWTIGSIPQKSDGVITINGVFLSEPPVDERIQTIFNYKPANFNSTFQQVQTEKIQIKDSVVSLSIAGPENIPGGDKITYTYTISQHEKESVFNLRLIPLLPKDFTITSTDPILETNQTYWNISELPQNQPKTFSIKGKYTSSANGEQNITGQIGFVDSNIFIKQKETMFVSKAPSGILSPKLIIEGSDKDISVNAGQTLHGTIGYSNTGTDTAESVTFSLSISGNDKKNVPIDWNKADLRGGKRSNQTISWNESAVSSLKKINPNDEGNIDFILPLLSSSTSSFADKLTFTISTSAEKIGSVSSPNPIESTPLIVTINSNTSFNPEVRYFTDEGTPIGSGALPPKVGQSTTYRVYWNLSNSLHELSGVDVSSNLPSSVKWIDSKQADIGSIDYNPTTRSVRWTVSKLPSSIPSSSAWFDIKINPTSNEIGSSKILTGQTNFSAKDSVTNNQLSNSFSSLTTELPTDEFAKGKSVVVK